MFARADILSFCIKLAAFSLFLCSGNVNATSNKQALQCSTPGQCVGSNLIFEGGIETKQDCHQKCKDFNQDECKWFTYHASQSLCLLFSNCANITEAGCDSCITGEKGCDLYSCGIQGACLVIN